jgi:hypothetical protein
MKKSFILHNDSLDILDEISIEQAGKLFIAIRNFNIGKEQELDNETKLLFLHFKNQFIRDNEKYKNKSEVNAINGSKGGKRKVANATKRKRTLKDVAILADNDSDNDNDNKNINKKILFINSPYYSKKLFAEQFPDWSREKLAYYYDAVLAWSNEGNKKIDWIATVKNWAKRDEKEGKITFNKPTPTILQGII